MDTISVTASELKNNVSEILNKVHFGKVTAIVEKHGKPIAKIMPVVEKKKTRKKDIAALLDKYFGILPDFPNVTKDRRSRKKSITL